MLRPATNFKPGPPDWENPSVLHINKRPSHAPLRSITSLTEASAQFRRSSLLASISSHVEDKRRVQLSGCAWAFKLFPNPGAVPSDFAQTQFKTEGWTQIQVPYSWECAGHGTPIYTNFVYPIPVNPPFVPHDDNPTGCFRHEFVLTSQQLAGKRAYLQFDGVDSAFYCWLNGHPVGFSKDSRLPAEFDVTHLLVQGSNLLGVQVIRWSDATYLEDQDMWRLSGIHRHVHLLFKPDSAHIADFAVRTPLAFGTNASAAGCGRDAGEGLLSSAHLEVDVHVASASAETLQQLQVVLHLLSPEGSPALEARTVAVKAGRWYARGLTGAADGAAAGAGGTAEFRLDMREALGGTLPLLWSAEEPHLYQLVLELRAASVASTPGEKQQQQGAHGVQAEVLEFETCQVGFRHTAVRGARLLHNGRPIMLRGVNRHETNPRTGKALQEQDMVADALAMKRAGFNAVRCSHYPNHEYWYEVCSVVGLYVVDEANIETHGFDPQFINNAMNPACSPEWLPAMLDRVVRMFGRDKNYPCIIMWSLGNESGYGPAHDAMAAYLRSQDHTRPIHYEGGGSRTPATDVVCPMYARLPQLRALADLVDKGKETRPIMLCEYAHSMGNSTGNLAEYWQLFASHPSLIGGFIWDWVDQSLVAKTSDGMPGGEEYEYWAYGGDFGDTPNDAQFCANGLLFANRQPKPALAEAAAVMAPMQWGWAPAHGGAGPAPSELPAGPWDQRLRVTLRNAYDFLDTSHLDFQWRLVLDGVPVPLPLPAGAACANAQAACIPQAVGKGQSDGNSVKAAATTAGQSQSTPVGAVAALPASTTPGHWNAVGAHSAVPARTMSELELPVTLAQLMGVVVAHQSSEAWLELRALVDLEAEPDAAATRTLPPAWALWAPCSHVVSHQQLRLPDPPTNWTAMLAPAPTEPQQQQQQVAALAHHMLVPRALRRSLLPPPPTPPPLDSPFGALGAGVGSLGTYPLEACLESSGDVVVQGPRGLKVVVSGATGCLSSLSLCGQELLLAEVAPCLWRAATDNDRGGSGGTSYAARWVAAGLDRMKVSGPVQLEVLEVPPRSGEEAHRTLRAQSSRHYHRSHPLSHSQAEQEQPVRVRCTWTMRPGAGPQGDEGSVVGAGVGEVGGAHWLAKEELDATAPSSTQGSAEAGTAVTPVTDTLSPEGEVHVVAVYEIYLDGMVVMDWMLDTTSALPARLAKGLQRSLPRVGLTFATPAHLNKLTWVGCGPHESYPDRKSSALVGYYHSLVEDLHVPYIFPQECGGRADVRWAVLQSSGSPNSLGLAMTPVYGTPPLQVNVGRYGTWQLHQARHDYELELLSACEGPRTHVHLDCAHMGVGGDDSWSPSVHAAYLVPPAVRSFALALCPCSSAQ